MKAHIAVFGRFDERKKGPESGPFYFLREGILNTAAGLFRLRLETCLAYGCVTLFDWSVTAVCAISLPSIDALVFMAIAV